MTKLGKIAIVGAAVGAGVYLAQKCMPKMSVFFAHEDEDDTDVADEKKDAKEDDCDCCNDCDGHLCEIHAIPLSEAPEDVRAVIQAIDGALRKCHADAENADENDEDLNVEDYGLTDEDFENLDMLFESDDFEQPNGQFEESYFTV
jgi:hypothetical protein